MAYCFILMIGHIENIGWHKKKEMKKKLEKKNTQPYVI